MIEVVIYLSIVSLITVPLIMVTLEVSRSSADGAMLTRIQERNRVAYERLVSDFRFSLAGTAVVSNAGKVLSFTAQAGFNGAGAAPGPTIRYEIRLAVNEAANAIDDNGNGLVDEGLLVRIDEDTGERLTLTETLSTIGSFFAPSGSGVAVTLISFGSSQHKSDYGNSIGQVERAVTLFPMN